MNGTLLKWQQTEITLTIKTQYQNPYTDIEVWARFKHETGDELVRPAFWDGDDTWRIRFTSPLSDGVWSWECFSKPVEPGLAGQKGELVVIDGETEDPFQKHGFWHIPTSHRNLYHADGTPALLVADTAWALPWRATLEECEIFAHDRQSKGFNAALLMSVQPDRQAHGPRRRSVVDGFEIGFEDLPAGHINQINTDYFKYLDHLAEILIRHGIVPVWQPVFHGYGWRGGDVAGAVIPATEYARYCRYLVARYGAQPAVWLVAADGDGLAPGVDTGGYEIERWDAYQQPTGIHYAPHQYPWAYQEREWLDFQWCQTGHNGEHTPQRLATMWEKRPVKAIANGEPTYEQIGEPGRAAGWWQGHEAWTNLTSGGTMGAVYGAGSLWQWRPELSEAYPEWCMARDFTWRDALHFEGSRYVGNLTSIFADLPFSEMQPDYCHTFGRLGLIVPGKLLIVYLPNGGKLQLAKSDDVPGNYRVIDPKNGSTLQTGKGYKPIEIEAGEPRIVIYT